MSKKRISMEGMISNACSVCDKALDPKTAGVPRNLMAGCKGVALISVVEAGFVFSGNVGTGVIMSHDVETKKWSPPSAVGLAGVGWGLLAGASVKDVLIVCMDDAAINALSGDGQLKLGGQLGVTAGPVGREVEGSVNVSSKGAGVTFTYTFSKGLFAGAGIEGAVLSERASENEAFYGQPLSPRQILFGESASFPQGKGVEELHHKLNLLEEGQTSIGGPAP